MLARHSMFVAVVLTVGLTGGAVAADPAIQIIHNSPSEDAAVIDIYLNGGASPIIGDLAFRAATGFIILPAGMYTIGIAPGTSTGPEDIMASFGPVDLAVDTKTIVMAAGELDDDFDLMISPLMAVASAGQVGLKAFHGAPDAPPVDIAALGVGNVFTNLAYKEFQGYSEVPEDDYILTVAPTGEDPIAAFSAILTGLGGNTAVVFTSGFMAGDPAFGLFAALTDGTVIELPATVSTSKSSWSDVKASYR